MLGLLSAAVGTSIGIASMWDKVMGSSMALSQFNAQTGLSVVRLQQWQNVGEAMGDTAEGVADSIMSASANLSNLKRFGTGTGVSAYNLLGIDPRQVKDVWDLIGKLQGRLKTWQGDRTQFAQRIQEMGFSGAWMKTLMADFDRFANKSSVKTQEQIDRMVMVEAKMKNLGQTITSVFSDVFVSFSPQLTSTITEFATWLVKNKTGIVEGMKSLGKGLVEGIKTFTAVAKDINSLVDSTVKWKGALIMLAGVYTYFNPLLKTLLGIYLAMKLINFYAHVSDKQTPEEEKAWGKIDKNRLMAKRQAKGVMAAGGVLLGIANSVFEPMLNPATGIPTTSGGGSGSKVINNTNKTTIYTDSIDEEYMNRLQKKYTLNNSASIEDDISGNWQDYNRPLAAGAL